MPVITRFQLKNSNAMRDRRARIRAINRDNIVETRPVCTLEISQYSESSDDETDSVCSSESSECLFETDSEYIPETDSETEEEENPEDALARLKEEIAELEKRIEIENTPENGRSWCGVVFSNLVFTSMFIMYCAYIVDKAHYNVA